MTIWPGTSLRAKPRRSISGLQGEVDGQMIDELECAGVAMVPQQIDPAAAAAVGSKDDKRHRIPAESGEDQEPVIVHAGMTRETLERSIGVANGGHRIPSTNPAPEIVQPRLPVGCELGAEEVAPAA